MCGGIGKRMYPLMTDKSLVKFLGKPLILHQIESAQKAGIRQFIVITNPENHKFIQSALHYFNDIEIDFALQEEPLGMSNALLSAFKLMKNEPFILVSSNDVFDSTAYTALIEEYERHESHFSAYICAKIVTTYFPGGYLVVNTSNMIDSIYEKPPQGQEPSNLINIVLHLHTNTSKLESYLLETSSSSDDIYEKALNRMIKDGCKLKAVVYNQYWQSIKYPWHILNMMDYFHEKLSKHISSDCTISDKATIADSVVIENGVKIMEGAIIRGPSYIGKGTIIGNNTLIRNSSIGNDCVIGFGTEIKHSHIGDRCWFHSNYIGDSVIEDDCSFGAGAVTANFRHDETNIKIKLGNDRIDTGTDKLGSMVGIGCRIGIHASLMPGTRIGAYSAIGAHVYLVDDVEPNRKVLAESHNRILVNESNISGNKRQKLLKNFNG